MNTIRLENFLKQDNVCKNYFIGVYPRDQLPLTFKTPCAFIINTHKSSLPGEHWLAFYYDRNNNGVFFDSFGLHPQSYGLDKYLDKTSIEWKYNNHRLQSFFSEYCGHYCLFFIYFMCRNYSLDYILDFFSSDYNKNDIIVKEFILKN